MPVNRDSHKLLRTVVQHPSDAAARQIRELAERICDWDLLFHLAEEHGVLPLLFSRLVGMHHLIPQAMQEQFQSEYKRNVFHCTANAAELVSVLKTFDAEGISAMPFKGIVLGVSVYHDLAARPAGDLDLLIHLTHLTRATALLLERGYELKTPTRADGSPAVPDYYEYHFERPADGMILELRWQLDLTQSKFRHNLGMNWVWPRRRIAMLSGAVVPDMSPEIKLLVLCMHGSKHAWSRLIWVCDVAQLLHTTPGLNWQEVIHEAKSCGLWRALALGVLLAHRIAGTDISRDVLLRFEKDAAARKLVRHIEENLFAAPGSIPEGRVPYSFLLLGLRDRIKFFLSLEFIRPNERDRLVVPLPKSLHSLYYLVRPFRLLWDRSAR